MIIPLVIIAAVVIVIILIKCKRKNEPDLLLEDQGEIARMTQGDYIIY